MTRRFLEWMFHKWQGADAQLVESYRVTFSGEHGTRVLQHLLDSVYCTIYEGNDPNEAVAHNARRSVVHEILANIDIAEHPERYRVSVESEAT